MRKLRRERGAAAVVHGGTEESATTVAAAQLTLRRQQQTAEWQTPLRLRSGAATAIYLPTWSRSPREESLSHSSETPQRLSCEGRGRGIRDENSEEGGWMAAESEDRRGRRREKRRRRTARGSSGQCRTSSLRGPWQWRDEALPCKLIIRNN